MKAWFKASLVIGCAGMLASSAFFVGCSSDGDSGHDSGTDSSTGTDTGTGTDSGSTMDSGNKQDTGTMDSGTMDSGTMMEGGIPLDCNAYCTAMLSVCTGAMNGQYLDNATCLSMCANFPKGTLNDVSGDTLGCRIYHVTVASQSAMNANTHCPHAGPYGFGQCGGECEDFCLLYDKQCGAGNFGDGGCDAGCPGIPNPANTTMSFLSGSGNTLDCREYHLENAYQAGNMNGAGHCAHTTLSGGGVCQ